MDKTGCDIPRSGPVPCVCGTSTAMRYLGAPSHPLELEHGYPIERPRHYQHGED